MQPILLVTRRGQLCPLAARLEAEGADVAVYIHEPAYRARYDGGMLKRPLSSPAKLRTYLRAIPPGIVVLIDGAKAAPTEPEDRELLELEADAAPGEGLFGRFADSLVAAGATVYGASSAAEALSTRWASGALLAQELGLPVVDSVPVTSSKEALYLLRASAGRSILRSQVVGAAPTYLEARPGELLARIARGLHPELEQVPCLLQPRLEGVYLREEAWWDGASFRYATLSMERGHMAAGDRGPVTESATTLTWFVRRSLVPWERLGKRMGELGYRGPVSFRFAVDGGESPRVVGVFMRPVLDALYGFLSLLVGPVSTYLTSDLFGGFQTTELAATVRASVHPYPLPREALKGPRPFEAGAPVLELHRDFWPLDVRQTVAGLELAGTDGLVGVGVAVDSEPAAALRRAQQAIERTRITAQIAYRDDFAGMVDSWMKLRPIALAP